jgi:hypothetical protein
MDDKLIILQGIEYAMEKAHAFAFSQPALFKALVKDAWLATFDDARQLVESKNPYCGFLAVSILNGITNKEKNSASRRKLRQYQELVQSRTVDDLLEIGEEMELTLASMVAGTNMSLARKVAKKGFESYMQKGTCAEDMNEALKVAAYLEDPFERRAEVLRRACALLKDHSDPIQRDYAAQCAKELSEYN